MPARRDRLARDFVEAALELHRRRLWRELPGDALFLLRVPTEEHPLAASVMGQAGEEFGLALVRGEGALRGMAALCSGPATEDVSQAGDLLSLTFEPWAALDDPFRRVVRAAGMEPRRDRAMPMAVVKRPWEHARPAGRPDLRTLVWAVRGVIAAHDAGELRPTSVPAEGGRGERRGHLLELEVAGKPRQPTVTARWMRWPDRTDRPDPPPLLALPDDLGDLPRLDVRWLLARVPLAARIEDDERSVFGLLVVDEATGLVLDQQIALGDGLAPAAELLERAFRGEGGATGRLPRAIVFDSPQLSDACAPALAALGIEALVDREHPELNELAATLKSAFCDRMEGEPLTLESLELWKQLDRGVCGELADDAVDERRATPRAWKRYFGSEEQAHEVLECLPTYSPFGAFAEWLAADYRATKRSRTILEKRLESDRLDPAMRELLEARGDALLSIFRVETCDPGAVLEVEDVLTGERHLLHDRALSACELEGFFLPLRLLDVEVWTFPMIAGPPLNSLVVNDALNALEALGAELSPAGLRRDAHLVGRLWPWFLEIQERRPVLQNTDGDPIEPCTATFRAADPGALERALTARDDLDHVEEENSWIWLRANPSKAPGEATMLGQLQLLDDCLVLEVNSRARLERARAWLEALPGVRFERATARAVEADELPLDDRLPGPPPAPPSAEVQEGLEHFLRSDFRRWLDERVPLLGDLTPREACATEDGRRRVARLVRTMPPIATPSGPIEAPREELLRELGIGPGE